jgi:diguanylate cyclase (GGDEF)-like protein
MSNKADLAALIRNIPDYPKPGIMFRDVSSLLLDADGLGALNESHGRPAADRFLRESAQRLARTVRAADLVARFGGDEIAVLLPMTPSNQARATAKRLRRALTTPVIEPGCTWSVGVGTLQGHLDEDAAGLLARVDRAVLEAKSQGGNATPTEGVGRKNHGSPIGVLTEATDRLAPPV